MNNLFVSLVREHAPPRPRVVSLGYPDFVPVKDRLSSQPIWDSLGATLTVLDVPGARSTDLIIDLNDPLPDDLRGQFDLLINPGTYEHVWDIASAFRNGYDLLRPGGVGVHTAPHQRGKHGFWNINEATFSAFYRHHGGEILAQQIEPGTLFAVTQNGPARTTDKPPQERKRVW